MSLLANYLYLCGMAKKKKTLPANFGELLEAKDLEALKAVFNECELNAYDRYSFKKPALSFYDIPLELMDWLIAQGADINVKDEYDRTPLHYHAQVNNVERVALLLEKSADIEAQDKYKNTPLHFAEYNAEAAQLLIEKGADIKAKNNMGHNVMERLLSRLYSGYIERAVKATEIYLKAGLKPSKYAKEQVTRVGEDFEFRREDSDTEWVEKRDVALQQLYKLFDVPPVPKRIQHDGKSPIVLTGETWEKRYEQAWELLVPSSGRAFTVQGEVVRIAGKVNDELLRNAMGNWDREYRKMLNAISGYLQQGNSLSESELTEVADIQKHILEDDGAGSHRLCELATLWVTKNPEPMALEKVNYKY